MAVLNLLAAGVAETVKVPGGIPWEWLILKVFDFVANYGWRIIVFTVLLKLVLLPLDIYQKYCMRKNQKITERLKPEMEKLEKAYGNDRQTFAQKQMELNKKEGFSYFSSCLPMILTLVIFIWLWNSMTNISRYMIAKQYVEWDDRYMMVQGYLTDIDYFAEKRDATTGEIVQPAATDEEKARIEAIVLRAVQNYNKDLNGQIEAKEAAVASKQAQLETAEGDAATALQNEIETLKTEIATLIGKKIEPEEISAGMIPTDPEGTGGNKIALAEGAAAQAVADLYADSEESNREDFLWIKNIWSPDVPWKKPISDWSAFQTATGKFSTDAGKLGIDGQVFGRMFAPDNYNNVTVKLRAQENQANGYLILPILAIGFSFLSYFISQRQQKKSGQAPVEGAPGGGAMKFMMILMPIMMGVFALTYSAAFTLYIVVNSATTIVVNLLSSLVIALLDKRETSKATATVVRYGRPDPNDLQAKNKKNGKTKNSADRSKRK